MTNSCDPFYFILGIFFFGCIIIILGIYIAETLGSTFNSHIPRLIKPLETKQILFVEDETIEEETIKQEETMTKTDEELEIETITSIFSALKCFEEIHFTGGDYMRIYSEEFYTGWTIEYIPLYGAYIPVMNNGFDKFYIADHTETVKYGSIELELYDCLSVLKTSIGSTNKAGALYLIDLFITHRYLSTPRRIKI